MINLYIFIESSIDAYGTGTYIRELTAILKNGKINVCIIHLYSDQQDKEVLKVEYDNVKHYHIPSPTNRNSLLDRDLQRTLYYQNVVYLLRLWIDDKKNLIFHLNATPSCVLAKELKRVFACTIIRTIHELWWCYNLSGNITLFKKILASKTIVQNDLIKKSVIELYLKDKEFFETVDHIICLSENTRQILQDDYQIESGKLTVIYNGLPNNNSVPDKSVLRHKYHIPNIPIILFVGRLHDIKGLTQALRAFKIVLATQPQCHFIIAGHGTFDVYMKECEDIWMHVTWTGLIDKDKLYDLYSIADIGIMPSFHEQCSYVAIEMMMHGVPLIASTSTGLCEMVENGDTGLHIPVIEYDNRVEIDTSLFAEKMLFLLQNSQERERMGVNARRRYEMVYSSEIFRQNMLNFYQSFFAE